MSLIISTKNSTIVNANYQKKSFTEYLNFGTTKGTAIITDPDVLIYYNNVIANGGLISSSTILAVENFVKKLKNDGIWTKITEAGIFAGGNLRASLTKLKYATTSPYFTGVNLVEADYVETGVTAGIKGNGSNKYLDTNYTGNFIGSSAHLGAYVKGTEASGASKLIIGKENSGGTIFSYLGWINAGAWDVGVVMGNSAPGSYTPQTPEATFKKEGLLIVATNGSLSQQFYVNASAVGNPVSTSAVTLPSISYYLLADNANGSATSFCTRYMRYYTIGSGLSATDVANYNSAIQSLQIALSRSV